MLEWMIIPGIESRLYSGLEYEWNMNGNKYGNIMEYQFYYGILMFWLVVTGCHEFYFPRNIGNF